MGILYGELLGLLSVDMVRLNLLFPIAFPAFCPRGGLKEPSYSWFRCSWVKPQAGLAFQMLFLYSISTVNSLVLVLAKPMDGNSVFMMSSGPSKVFVYTCLT